MNYDSIAFLNKVFNHSDIETTLRYIGVIKPEAIDEINQPFVDFSSETFLNYIGAPGYDDVESVHSPFEAEDPLQSLKNFFNHDDVETTLRYIGFK